LKEATLDIAARGYANPDLLWSPETLRERLGQSGLAIIDFHFIQEAARRHLDMIERFGRLPS
jgi:hypothetical protein